VPKVMMAVGVVLMLVGAANELGYWTDGMSGHWFDWLLLGLGLLLIIGSVKYRRPKAHK
jgi:hypothetical protein